MTAKKGTYTFTTPIYYVNAAPHLGTAYTTRRWPTPPQPTA